MALFCHRNLAFVNVYHLLVPKCEPLFRLVAFLMATGAVRKAQSIIIDLVSILSLIYSINLNL